MAKYDPDRHFVQDLGPNDPVFSVRGFPLLAFDRADDTLLELFPSANQPGENFITQVDPSGDPITAFGGPDPAHFSYGGLGNAEDLAVDPLTHAVYVLKGEEVDVLSRDPSVVTVPTTSAGGVEELSGTSATLTGAVDPDGIDTTDCHFEWGTTTAYGNTAPCGEGDVLAGGSGENPVTATIAGLSKGSIYHYRLLSENANGVPGFTADREFSAADPPALGEVSADHITSDSVRINLALNANGADADYHVEIGTDTSYGMAFPVPDATLPAFRPGPAYEVPVPILSLQDMTQDLHGLDPATLYHYRIVAENAAGVITGTDRIFKTFAAPSSDAGSCPNAQARQQTSAADLLDCRAYELVSAPDSGGYDVRSSLNPGVSALSTSPEAADEALYSMQSGTIPGVAGHPTNRGADPYIATRGANGWSTRYVGLPANNPFATGPFASPLSDFDSALETFAFGGEEICDPCFADGSTDVPLRLPDGSLVQGMAGSIDPPGAANPAATIREPLSDDGSHLVFGTTAQFEPDANSNGTDATIYSRDLKAGTTEVVSTDDTGATIANGDGVAELAVTADGSRTVIGEKLATDSAGNDYYHLYLHIKGTQASVDLTPGTISGALFGGMTEDGTRALLTTADALSPTDTDTSTDAYAVEIAGPGSITPQQISAGSGGTGNTDACSPAGIPNNWNAVSGNGKCNVLAFAGGTGVAAQEGSFYFISPEQLDGPSNGTQDQPNLYVVSPGSSSPHFVKTIDSSLGKQVPPSIRPILTQGFGGSHVTPETMTVDQANGDLYVYEPGFGRISRYNESGGPANFTDPEAPSPDTNRLTGLEPLEYASQVAVDNSGGSLDRALFASGLSNVRIFSQEGKPLGELNGSGSDKGFFEEVCGVAVDQTNGDVFIAEVSGNLWRYAPSSATLPIDDADYAVTGIKPEGMSETCNVAADAGKVYLAQSAFSAGPVRQFEASSFAPGSPPTVSGSEFTEAGSALSIDPQTHEIYVNDGSRIHAFNATGEKQLTLELPLAPGEFLFTRGVAVNASSHHVYMSRVFNFKPGGDLLLLIEFGYEQPPFEPIDDPAIVHAVRQSAVHDSSDFQVTPDGEFAAFASPLPPAGFDGGGRDQVFRYGATGDALTCVSCSPTLARPVSDATLTPYGSSLLEDGRVFFTTGEALTLRDSNEKRDAYEWSDGAQQLISTGTSSSDSELLSASADGKDAFFFTRQKLV
ncbi:MAG TPA: hypothetical protein VIY71_08125, partial [Solirubrobacterales bacterium]